MNKYGAVLCQGYGSKLEAAVGNVLRLRERAKEIFNVRRQHSVRLGSRYWKCDFSYEDIKTKETIWVEAKGLVIREFLWIKEMWKLIGPGTLEIWGGDYRRPYTIEIVEKGRFFKPGAGEQ